MSNVATAPQEMATADIRRIMELLPHRPPFLMIDRVIDIVEGTSATGIKNITINEPQFNGHFPGMPVMPGVLLIEAMAQTAGALVVHTLNTTADGKVVYFMTIDKARFRAPSPRERSQECGPREELRRRRRQRDATAGDSATLGLFVVLRSFRARFGREESVQTRRASLL
jgi:beta-hydroxyacyl-ACP dehydratase FabZ